MKEVDDDEIVVPPIPRTSNCFNFKETFYLKLSTIIGSRGVSLEYVINTVDRNITSARSEMVEASDVVDIPTINNSDYTADHVTYFKMYFKNDSKAFLLILKKFLLNTPTCNDISEAVKPKTIGQLTTR